MPQATRFMSLSKNKCTLWGCHASFSLFRTKLVHLFNDNIYRVKQTEPLLQQFVPFLNKFIAGLKITTLSEHINKERKSERDLYPVS